MGAVKSVPLVGEAATAVESGSKTVAAGACALVGKTDTAGRLIEGAGDAWVDWSERSVFPVAVRLATAKIKDDPIEGNRVADKFLGSVGDAADGIPVVGHIKGIYHLANDDEEKYANSMKAATRTTVVATACALTGGAAAATGLGLAGTVATGAAVGAESGVAYDLTVSVAQSAGTGQKKNYGTLAAWDNFVKTKDPNGFMDALLSHVGDAAAGAMESAAAYELANAYENAKQSQQTANNLARNIGEEGARQAMDLATDMEPTVERVGNENNVVASRVIDRETGQNYDGVNRQTRQQIRTQENLEQGMTRSSARREARQSSDLMHKETTLEQRARQNVTENGQPVRDLMRTAIMEEESMPMVGENDRLPSSCAEQQAYQRYFESLGDRAIDVPQPPTNTRVVTIRLTPEGVETVQRCNHCRSFMFEMGECPTDRAGPTPLQPSNVYYAHLASNNYWKIVQAGLPLASPNAGVGRGYKLCHDHDCYLG